MNKVINSDLALKGTSVKELGVVFTLVNNERLGRLSIIDSFDNHKTFRNRIREYERIRTGKLKTFMLDMSSTKGDIINLTNEFIQKIKDDHL